jgi:uncharacterized protein YdaU (DUF1376 family)
MEAAEAMGMTFAKFFPSDWRTGCMNLDLEEEGLYIRICAYHYDVGKALPDDYPYCAHVLRVNLNKFTKVINSLIGKGKIIRAQGLLFNERVVEEFDRYRQEHAARAAAAKKREEARKEKLKQIAEELEQRKRLDATPHVAPPVTPQLTPPASMGVPHPATHGSPTQRRPQNVNNFNDYGTTAVAEPWHSSTTNPETRIQNPELLPPTHSPRAQSGGGELNGLNGATYALVRFISEHARVEDDIARGMLEANIKAFSPKAMLEAHATTVAAMSGGIIAQPYKYMIGAAKKIQAEISKQPAKKPFKPSRYAGV